MQNHLDNKQPYKKDKEQQWVSSAKYVHWLHHYQLNKILFSIQGLFLQFISLLFYRFLTEHLGFSLCAWLSPCPKICMGTGESTITTYFLLIFFPLNFTLKLTRFSHSSTAIKLGNQSQATCAHFHPFGSQLFQQPFFVKLSKNFLPFLNSGLYSE